VLQGLRPLDRAELPTDVVAGITLAALGIPEVMGYADIAGMPVVLGLYTILVPIAVFAVLGSSRHLVVGADSATAAILAAGLAPMAAAGSPEYVHLGAASAVMAGVVLVVARFIRLGFLADFLSRSVLIGFLTGVGVQVAMMQLAGMTGVADGSGTTLEKFARTVAHLGDTDVATVAVSAGVLAVILGGRMIDRRVPGALIAVIAAIVVSWRWDLAADGVATLGAVPGGLPALGVPDVGWKALGRLAPTVGAMVLVILAQSAATARAYAAREEEQFSEDVDLVGLGAANVAAGFTGTFVVNGSPTKTQMVDSAGGRSQLSQLVTAAVVLVVLLFLTGPLEYMPKAVLAAVVFLIGVELVDVDGMRGILAVRRDEFLIASLTALVVIVVGVEQGVLLAIVLSVLDYVRRGYRPSRRVIVLDGTHLESRPLDDRADAAPGLVIYHFGASLFYANANGFEQDLLALAGRPGVEWVCVDAAAISDVDYTGWKTLAELHRDLSTKGVRLLFAELATEVRTELHRYGLLDLLGADSVFSSVGEVVEARRAALGGTGGARGGGVAGEPGGAA
jgi:high affinity sulfate transporter 1